MRDTSGNRWLTWRVALVGRGAGGPVGERFARTLAPAASAAAANREEEPAADGIRHALVARIRGEIEAGTYDTEEKWLEAEDRLIRAVGGR